MFIDVHCHLDMIDKNIKDILNDKVLIVTDGVNVETNRKALEYAKYENVLACLGIYPDHVAEMSDKNLKEEIDFILKNKANIIGIGEIGMDFKQGLKDQKKQEKYFKLFIQLAMKIDKPVVVHSRKAELECIEILESMNARKVVMHCFSGKLKLVERIIRNGWMLSIPTSVKNSEHFQRVIEMTPIEQLLCETDSPYLHPDREFPNVPGNVIESYKMIAKIKKMKLNGVEKKIEENFKRLFLE